MCSGGACGGVATTELSKVLPLVGSISAAGLTYAWVRWIGMSVIQGATEASQEIYDILKDHQPEIAQ